MSTELLVRGERRLSIISTMVLAALAAAVVLGTPGRAAFLPPCPLHALTGYFCPGCGTTRAFWYLVHGHPLRALGENVLSMLVLPFVLYDLGAVLTRRWSAISTRLRPWSLWTLFAVIVLFAVLRNLSAFAYLAPTDLH